MNRVLCPSCGHKLKYPNDYAGKQAKCQKCGGLVRLPPLSTPSLPENNALMDSDEARGAALARLFNAVAAQSAAKKLRPWTYALLAVGILNVLFTLNTAAILAFGSSAQQSAVDTGYLVMLGVLFVSLSSAGVTIVGALRMRALRSYRLAVFSCILAMVPVLSMCFVVGLPIGIAALIELRKADVRSAFT